MTTVASLAYKKITIIVNDKVHNIEIKSNETLLDILRKKLNIKSVKSACWQGDCGICLVLLDGKPIKSCLVLAQEVNRKSILTVEGLIKEEKLSKIQESFIKNGAIQCGFCTSAFLLMGHYLLSKDEPLNRESISNSLSGIICRCTGYEQIIDSILEVHLEKIE